MLSLQSWGRFVGKEMKQAGRTKEREPRAVPSPRETALTSPRLAPRGAWYISEQSGAKLSAMTRESLEAPERVE